MHLSLPYIIITSIFYTNIYTIHAVMNRLRLDFSASLSQVGSQGAVPVSHMHAFRLRVNSTHGLEYKIGNSRVIRQITAQSAPNQVGTRDQPSAANVNVAAIVGRFTLPVVLSLVCNSDTLSPRCLMHCLFGRALVRVSNGRVLFPFKV